MNFSLPNFYGGLNVGSSAPGAAPIIA